MSKPITLKEFRERHRKLIEKIEGQDGQGECIDDEVCQPTRTNQLFMETFQEFIARARKVP